MRINFSTINPVMNFNHQTKQNNFNYSNLKPLSQDTFSFGAASQKKQQKIDAFKNKLKEQNIDIEECPANKLFDMLGIKYKVDEKDGLLILEDYGQPKDFTFADLGVDENKLFEQIKEIKKNADFENSQVTNLGSLEKIGGCAWLKNSQITNLGNLQTIGGNAWFINSQVKNLGNLQTIGKNAYFNDSQVADLGNLEIIGGDAFFERAQLKNLGELKYIGGYAYFEWSKITNLSNLEVIGGDADFENSQVTSLGALQTIGGKLIIHGSKLKESDFEGIEIKGGIWQ